MKGVILALLVVAACEQDVNGQNSTENNICNFGEDSVFRCVGSSEECIFREWMCDGLRDCSDGSDEVNCNYTTGCDQHQFKCPGEVVFCIYESFLCDGENDCPDGSDEVDCPTSISCTDDEFKCYNSCIHLEWECDGMEDCPGGEDEINCAFCTDHEFHCGNRCIPLKWLCDGDNDCDEGEDEVGCDPPDVPIPCGLGMFNCSDMSQCIEETKLCDGFADCSDLSDEYICPIRCDEHFEFFCELSNQCVLKEWLCDGEKDCSEGEDEAGCVVECPDGEFFCGDGTCTDKALTCDGRDDCSTGLDELIGCDLNPEPVPCAPSQFQCYRPPNCIDGDLLCDGKVDCIDASDEANCPNRTVVVNECENGNGGCQQQCTDTQYSFLCSCLEGYRIDSKSNRLCKDVDECASPGTCSQLCFNKEGSYHCSCSEGYQIDRSPDGRNTCRAKGQNGYLLVTDIHSIQRLSLDGNNREVLVHRLPLLSSLDYNIKLGKLYWADHGLKSIMSSDMDGSNRNVLVHSGILLPQRVAVDWITGNIYWTDGQRRVIEVTDALGQYRRGLIRVSNGQPRALVLDPTQRYMYWTVLSDSHGDLGSICRASMDGQNQEVLHNTLIYWPNALTIEIPTQTLYWADAKLQIIETSNVDGTGRRILLSHGVNHPFSMSIFEDYLYWIDWTTRGVKSTFKSFETTSYQLLNGMGEIPTSIKAVHPALQPEVNVPHQLNNSGCQELRLLSSTDETGYTCACNTGTLPAVDGTHCQASENFILVSQGSSVFTISFDMPEPTEYYLPLKNIVGVVDVAINPKSGFIYWSDSYEKNSNIGTSNLKGLNPDTIINSDLGTPEGIEYDWLNDKLYFIDSRKVRLEVIDVKTGYRSALITKGLHKPRGLALHPTKGLMFWTDWGRIPKIERAALDGSNRIVIVMLNHTWPNGITVDTESDKLYWLDGYGKALFYSDLDGRHLNRVYLRPESSPMGIAVLADRIYWTDMSSNTLESLHKETFNDHKVNLRWLNHPLGIEAYKKPNFNVSNPCEGNNKNCSHLCLLRPSDTVNGQLEAVCECPTGMKLMNDGKTCQTNITKFILAAGQNDLRMISLEMDQYVDTAIPINGAHRFDNVDYDPILDEVYWIDGSTKSIMRASRKGGEAVEIVSSLGKLEGLAMDWIGRKLYFTDSYYGVIEVIDIVRKDRSVIIRTDFGYPQDIAINLYNRTLYWIEADTVAMQAVIRRSNLDGSNIENVTHQMGMWPKRLSVTVIDGSPVIYWTDSKFKTIFEYHESTQDTLVVAIGSALPKSVTYLDGLLYFSDVKSNSIYQISVNDGNKELISRNLANLLNIKAFDKRIEENYKLYYGHPCPWYTVSECSHLCLPSAQGAQKACVCSTGILLKDDKETCNTAPNEFIIFGSENSIHSISLVTEERDNVVIRSDTNHAIDIAFMYHSDPAASGIMNNEDLGYLFWTSINGTIQRSFFNGSCPQGNCNFVSNLHEPEGIAYDWISGNIYVAHTGRRRIDVITSDGLWRKTIVNDYLARPRGIAVHPRLGYLFWTDWTTNYGKIERSTLLGEDRRELLREAKSWPNSLHIDFESDLLYWGNGHTERIERMQFDGTGRETVMESVGLIFGISLYNHNLYWTEWQNRVLHKQSLVTDKTEELTLPVLTAFEKEPERLYGVTVVHPNRPKFQHPCSHQNGGCPFLCLMITQLSWKCSCPEGMEDQCSEEYHTNTTVHPTTTDSKSSTEQLTDTTSSDTTKVIVPTVTVEATTPKTTQPTTRPPIVTEPTRGQSDGSIIDVLLSLHPGILSAYIVIAVLALLIFAIIIIFLVVTFRVSRKRKAMLKREISESERAKEKEATIKTPLSSVKKSGTFKSVLLSGSVKLYTVDNSSQNSTTDFSATTAGHQQEMSAGSAVSGVESKGSNGDLRIDSVNVSTE